MVGPPFTGHFKVIADTPRGLQQWSPATPSIVTSGKSHPDTDAKAKPVPALERNLEIGRNAYEQNGKEVVAAAIKPGDKPNGESSTSTNGADASTKALDQASKGPEKTISCSTCGVDCTRVYYHLAKGAKSSSGAPLRTDVNVCANCFTELRIPGNLSQASFIKQENRGYTAIADRDSEWQDSEKILLLEAIDQFDENWDQIAEHVGTRTRDECVLHFLQMDIADNYVDAEPLPQTFSSLGLGSGRLPITQADNPILSVLGFLAGTASPAVTAAAASSTVAKQQEKLRESINKASASSSADKESANDAMQVDVQQSTTDGTTASASLALPLAAVAARASGLASHEEREMTRLVSAAVNSHLQKAELKLEHFNEMERLLEAERRELQRARRQLFLDRLAFKNRVKDVQERFKQLAMSSGTEGQSLYAQAMTIGDVAGDGMVFAGNGQQNDVEQIMPRSEDVKSAEL